jgi:hypothetical protein
MPSAPLAKDFAGTELASIDRCGPEEIQTLLLEAVEEFGAAIGCPSLGYALALATFFRWCCRILTVLRPSTPNGIFFRPIERATKLFKRSGRYKVTNVAWGFPSQ